MSAPVDLAALEAAARAADVPAHARTARESWIAWREAYDAFRVLATPAAIAALCELVRLTRDGLNTAGAEAAELQIICVEYENARNAALDRVRVAEAARDDALGQLQGVRSRNAELLAIAMGADRERKSALARVRVLEEALRGLDPVLGMAHAVCNDDRVSRRIEAAEKSIRAALAAGKVTP